MNIFISHSSKDRIIVDLFVEKILILGCGIDEEDIFCTSIEGLGIRNGEDFRNHIKENLMEADFAFLLISDNYKKSDICLNEMGALWAQENVSVKPLIFPSIDFQSIGTLYSVKQVSRIDSPTDLDELHEELLDKINGSKKVSRWNKAKTSFLEEIGELKEDHSGELIKSAEEFFSSFLKENINVKLIYLKSHPTLLDCKAIFTEDYYRLYFQYYCALFESITDDQINPFYPKYKFLKVTKSSAIDMFTGINTIAGGMVSLVKKNVINPNIDFYSVQFLENKNDKAGYSLKVYCHINGRWVSFPKPWQAPLKT